MSRAAVLLCLAGVVGGFWAFPVREAIINAAIQPLLLAWFWAELE